jgi:predicted nucleic acid-binding Zn ribbon protein
LAEDRGQVSSSQGVPEGAVNEKARGSTGSGRKFSQHRKKGRKSMPLVQILLALIVVGVLLWLVNRFIPMQGSIKSILNGVVVIAVVLWLLNIFGLFHSLAHIRVGT